MTSALTQVFKSVFGTKRRAQASSNPASSTSTSSSGSIKSYGRVLIKVAPVALKTNSKLHKKTLSVALEAQSTLQDCFVQLPSVQSPTPSTQDSNIFHKDTIVSLAELEAEEELDTAHISPIIPTELLETSTFSNTAELDDIESDYEFDIDSDSESEYIGALLADDDSESESEDEYISSSSQEESSTPDSVSGSESESEPESPISSVASDEELPTKEDDKADEGEFEAWWGNDADFPLSIMGNTAEGMSYLHL